MRGRANPPDAIVYRVVNLGADTIVETGIGDADEAAARLGREVGRVPGGRFAVEVRIPPDDEWLTVGTAGGLAS
jgi:hypothetical protein